MEYESRKTQCFCNAEEWKRNLTPYREAGKIKASRLELCYDLRNHSTALEITEKLRRMSFDESRKLGTVKLFVKKRLTKG